MHTVVVAVIDIEVLRICVTAQRGAHRAIGELHDTMLKCSATVGLNIRKAEFNIETYIEANDERCDGEIELLGSEYQLGNCSSYCMSNGCEALENINVAKLTIPLGNA
jgi:hypothetical protein